MATIDQSDPILKKVCLGEHDIAALRRIVEIAIPRMDSPLDDVEAIKAVAELIETAEVALEQSYAAIKRIVKERQDAGDPNFQEYQE